MISFKDYFYSEQRPILVFDGGMGTALQDLNLSAEDFGGVSIEGCNENLVRTKFSAVESVHRSYLEAGCDVIETNTFGATSIVLGEYNIDDLTYEINIRAANLARSLADEYSQISKPRFVAGSIGPTTKLPTLGHVSFDELTNSFQLQSEALIEGNVDLIVIETCQDILQVKSALIAINRSFNNLGKQIPIMVSVTMETTGTMLLGTEISAVVNILEPFPIDILGINCATGPQEMKTHIEYLSRNSPFEISCIPNAGLPENISGKAHYRLTPIELKIQLLNFVNDFGVRVIGGCCGTTPAHIKQLVNITEEIRKFTPNICQKNATQSGISSLYEMTNYHQDNSFLIVGERLNASGSKKVRDLLNEDNWDGLMSVAKSQLKEQAHVLDVNVDYVGRDGIKDMQEIVSRLVTSINLPLMLDSTDYMKMESGLKKTGGKCILNSTNYEDGQERFFKVLKLCKTYGAAVVIGTIDESGMARDSLKKIQIVERSYSDCINYGIKESDIFYDPLVLPISTGLEEDRKNAKETIASIKLITKKLPNVHIILGISNISFGLNPSARITLNSVFLNECIKAGLDSAIISPAKILPLQKIKEEHLRICLDLIYDNRGFKNDICTYDPLTELTNVFANISTKSLKERSEELSKLPVEERLKQHIIDGEKVNLKENLDLALKTYKPLFIINTFLLDGMKVVGDLFGSGKMQLPFVLQSAETMKYAVSILEPYMETSDSNNSSKGKFLIATVKGDVHDIGKNLVDIILTNNGYDVINLGIKQDISEIIKAYKAHNPDCIAMSGLLVKSTAFMLENLDYLNKEGVNIPVILGGAALTPKFVNQDCNTTYKGYVIYGKDAFTDLRFMDKYMEAKHNHKWDNLKGFLDSIPEGINMPIKSSLPKNISQSKKNTSKIEISTIRSPYVNIESPSEPPFYGTKVVDSNNIDFNKLFFYLDKRALFSGQWQFKRTKNQNQDQYNEFLRNDASNILAKWKDIVIAEELIRPSFVYGYFPCSRNGNKLEVYDPSLKSKIGVFEFPRQRGSSKYCISDYFLDAENNNPIDFIPMQAVTMGQIASDYSKELYDKNKYTDYLYFHGLTVQLAEALAEYSHSIIRIECGYSSKEPDNINAILAQKYQGCRYSFGYPACPNVSDSSKQLNWLHANRIGLSIDESDQLVPEQSTTAIIALHSQAKYFSA
ncbi:MULTISPECIES: methionine synthase [unclassified Prochlorococcus]|uniref:methionine synthase n=1 Tax=unclassified Prochlorococcus TaxID=2627481 RepID=UPI000533823F|nr:MULTISPECIES: methionine synthase [unclassified Prochlorococcus]KGG15282.1 5-methyltetrahydrofolate--homocysteine methyltransferase [Prochlorococcus sp. MIT 0602]KGG17559.1 5-methyltetrahydrofolate--homocysteine methyltransferase [Prochlorococcus sp. MIT 0603]